MQLHHIALRCADLERVSAFYVERLGLEILKRNLTDDGLVRSVWLRAGDVTLMLEAHLAGSGPEHGSAHVLAFRVDDLDAWARRLTAAGIAIDARSEWSLYFRDPDGHRLAVTVFRG